jgi:hypothetical protein
VPVDLRATPPYGFISCADAALRYDQRHGIFSTEYAAAFELGRLLALQNRGFASALYRYRARVAQAHASGRRAAAVQDALVGTAGGSASGSAGRAGLDLGDVLTGAVPQDLVAGRMYLPPREVARMLGRAVLLYGVPFDYLVPCEQMLPTESLRCFYLDPGWIATLVQGATSVGRAGKEEDTIDMKLRLHALRLAMVEATRVRQSATGGPQRRPVRLRWPLTGFLLRSQAVEGWQGIEMHALGWVGDGTGQTELAPLRIDRLAPDILLCIFNGRIGTLTMRQPPEGLHFSLQPCPARDAAGVLRLAALARDPGSWPADRQPASPLHTSAELAVALIDRADEFVFTVDAGPGQANTP